MNPTRSPRRWFPASLAIALALTPVALTGPAAAQVEGSRAATAVAGWRSQPRLQAAPKQELELRAVEDVAEKIEAGRENIQQARISTERITDILVRLRPQQTLVHAPASVTGATRTSTIVSVMLQIVTQGRISPTASANCDRFDGDVLVCTVECEGGVFGLRRGRAPGEHYLRIGLSEGDGSPSDTVTQNQGRGGFRIGACASSDSPAMLVMPRSGRLASDLRLRETP